MNPPITDWLKEQTAEQIRQFEAENRPQVDVYFTIKRGFYLGLVFENTGKKMARDVSVAVTSNFFPEMKPQNKSRFERLKDTKISLGIHQQIFISVCGVGKQVSCEPIRVDLKYRDEARTYNDSFYIEPAKHDWYLVDMENEDQIRVHLKEISANVKKMATKTDGGISLENEAYLNGD